MGNAPKISLAAVLAAAAFGSLRAAEPSALNQLENAAGPDSRSAAAAPEAAPAAREAAKSAGDHASAATVKEVYDVLSALKVPGLCSISGLVLSRAANGEDRLSFTVTGYSYDRPFKRGRSPDRKEMEIGQEMLTAEFFPARDSEGNVKFFFFDRALRGQQSVEIMVSDRWRKSGLLGSFSVYKRGLFGKRKTFISCVADQDGE